MKILGTLLAAIFLAASAPAFAEDNAGGNAAGDNTAGAAGTEGADAGHAKHKKSSKKSSSKKKHHHDGGMAGEGADGGM